MKLEAQHKHIMRLIKRDRDDEGWAAVSRTLYPHLSTNMPPELVEFESVEGGGGRARLTEEGADVLRSMETVKKWEE